MRKRGKIQYCFSSCFKSYHTRPAFTRKNLRPAGKFSVNCEIGIELCRRSCYTIPSNYYDKYSDEDHGTEKIQPGKSPARGQTRLPPPAAARSRSPRRRQRICSRAATPCRKRSTAGRPIDKLYIAAGETDRALARLAAMAKEAGAAVVETDRRKLDQLSATGAHQGVVAMVAAHAYATRRRHSRKREKQRRSAPRSSCATICRTRITSARSSARRSARARTASSSRSAAASA